MVLDNKLAFLNVLIEGLRSIWVKKAGIGGKNPLKV